MASKKTIRSNKEQIKYLCEYMHTHKDFAAGEFKTPQGAAWYDRQWSQIKAALDELGPNRSVEQWKVCWRDQKRKARLEGGALNKAVNATGNSVDVPELSQNATIILDTIGQEMALGCGPEESPIGFSGRTQHTVGPAGNPPLPLPSDPAQIWIPPPQTTAPAYTTAPPAHTTPSTPVQKRVRKINPPDRFLNAQLELNALMKELIKEVRRSNDLKKDLINLKMRRCRRH